MIPQTTATTACFCRHAGLVVRRMREIKGMTQSRLAQDAAANLSHISSLENHSCNISIGTLYQICNALDVRPQTVMRVLDCMQRSEALSEQALTGAIDDLAHTGLSQIADCNPD
jgi:transcriptional regulator with XRE-family HTH domain